MAETVIDANEISLNGVRYKITGPVQRTLSSVYPGKTVIGDYTKDSSPNLSTLGLSDHRGGIGLDVMVGEGDTNRSWYSTADIRFKGHLILPPLVVNTSNLPAAAVTLGAMVEFGGNLYLSIYTANAALDGVYKYNNSTDTWGNRVLAAGAAGLHYDAVAGQVGGTTTYIIFSDGRYIYYSTDGASWTTKEIDANAAFSMALWDDKLWCIGAVGYLSYLADIAGTRLNGGRYPGSGQVRALFVGRNSEGEQILYAAATDGLWAYDFGNSTFVQTGLAIPNLAASATDKYGVGVNWREAIYFSAETPLLKYDVTPTQATISVVSPDRDDGLPSGYGTLISEARASLTDLVVALNGTSTQKGVLIAWDGQGWRVLVELAASTNFSDSYKVGHMGLLVAGAYGVYRVWFSSDEGDYVKYINIPADLRKPLQNSAYTYAAAATHDWPWFTAGQSEVTKVGVRVKVETLNPTTAETVKVYYAINRSSTFQLMTNSTFTTGIITTAGVHTFDFPSVDTYASTTARTGTAFRSIQFRVVYARGGTTTNTPDVLSLTLEYYKKLDPKWQFQVEVDLNAQGKGGSPKEQRATLLTAQETTTLVEFTYRDPATNSDATFYVQARPVVGTEQTGYDERGTLGLVLVEV